MDIGAKREIGAETSAMRRSGPPASAGISSTSAVLPDTRRRKAIVRPSGDQAVQRLVEFARDEKLELLTASFLAENQAIERLFRSQGFTFSKGDEPEIRDAQLRL